MGLVLMVVGMVTVFLILMIVIFGSQLMIRLVNRIGGYDPALDGCLESQMKNRVIPLLRGSFQPLLGQITVEGVDVVAGQILHEHAFLFEKRGDAVVDI